MGLGSKVEIFNSALAKIGVEGVTSPTDNNTRARLCNQIFDICRRDVLRDHPWRFAKKEATLNLSSDSPVLTEYTKIYQLPQDNLRVLKVEDFDIPWEVKQDKIYTTASSCLVEYIYDCEQVGLFDSNFCEALAYRMAMDLAQPLTGSSTLSKDMEGRYKQQLSKARFSNATEAYNPSVQANDWLNGRY